MTASNSSSPFGAKARGRSRSGFDLWETISQARESWEQRVASRIGAPHDIRAAVLEALAVEPMHGFDVIHSIAERSHGSWKPTPGQVYPTLQLLVDEGLATAEDAGGRKTYTLTEAGRLAAATASTTAASDGAAGWDLPGMRAASRAGAIPKAGAQLAQAAAQVAQAGTSEQVTEAVAVLDEARRKLYSILAQD